MAHSPHCPETRYPGSSHYLPGDAADAGNRYAEARHAQGCARGVAPREHPDHGRCLCADHRGKCSECDELPDNGNLRCQDACDAVRIESLDSRTNNPEEKNTQGRETIGPTWTKLGFQGGCKCLIYLVDAVGIEPTTCRLRATEFASPPAAFVCYKPLYKIRLRAAQKLLLAIHTARIVANFDGAWAQKWAQSFGANPAVETVRNRLTCRSLVFPTQSVSSPSESH